MIDDEVLGLAGGIAGNRDDNAGGLAVDLTGVLLEKAFVAVVAGKIELLVLYSSRASSTSFRTASAPWSMPCIAAPSPVTSSASLSSHHG